MLNVPILNTIKAAALNVWGRVKYHHVYTDFAIRRQVWVSLYEEHLTKYLEKATPIDPNIAVDPKSIIRFVRKELATHIKIYRGCYIGAPNTIFTIEEFIGEKLAEVYKEPYPRLIDTRYKEWQNHVNEALQLMASQYPTFAITFQNISNVFDEQNHTPRNSNHPSIQNTGPLFTCKLMLALTLWASRSATELDMSKISKKDAHDIQTMIKDLDILQGRPSRRMNDVFLAIFENKAYDPMPFTEEVIALVSTIEELNA